MLYFPICTFYFSILFYSMVVVSDPSSGVTSCQKWDVKKRVETHEAVVHQSQEDFHAFLRNLAARYTSVFHWKWYCSISLLTPPAPLMKFNFSPPSPPFPLLLPSLYPTNHSHRVDKGTVGAIETFEFLERQTAIDLDMDGCIPKEFDPTFQLKSIAFTCSNQVLFLPIVEDPLFFAPFFFAFV